MNLIENIKKYWVTYIYEFLEIGLIMFIGFKIGTPISNMLAIFFTLAICRMLIKDAKHYKDWYLCFIWSTIIFTSLFLLVKINLFVSILGTGFAMAILSGKGDIKNITMWNNKSKYQPLYDFMTYNFNDERLIEYEKHLKKNDILKYNLFQLKFKQRLSWDKIENITEIYDRKKIQSELDQMYHHLKVILMLSIED